MPGDNCESCFGNSSSSSQTFQDKPHVPVRVHVPAPGVRQLYPPGPQVLQSEHHGLYTVQEQHCSSRFSFMCNR